MCSPNILYCKYFSVNFPKNSNFSNPSYYGLEGVRNFHLKTDDDITIGVWQILPGHIVNKTKEFKRDDFEEYLSNEEQNIIIYNHGNSGTRAANHRVELYQVLRKHFHVIAYDYRSKLFIFYFIEFK